MRKKSIKILSLLLTLTLALVLGLVPGMTAYAEGEDITSDITLIATSAGCRDFDNDKYYGDGDKKIYTIPLEKGGGQAAVVELGRAFKLNG